MCAPAVFASDHSTDFFREWSKIDITGSLGSQPSDLRYEAFLETRNQETRLDFAPGLRLTPLVSLWSGFTWISPNDGSAQVYRPWQQVIWELFDKNPTLVFQTRTRLEELKQAGQPEWLWRVRERLRVAFPNRIARKFTPVIYEEIFFDLNKPSWVNTQMIDQNRLFIGVDSPIWKSAFVEIGYVNQYRYTTPVNQISHILSISFMIFFP